MLVKVCTRDDLEDTEAHVFDVDGLSGIVFHSDGALYACQRYCTHELFPLEFGLVDGHVLCCTYHDAEFDLRSGAVLKAPATEGLQTYDVHIEGNDVLVDLPIKA